MDDLRSFLEDLPIGPREAIIDKLPETGFVWREGSTLHVNCILLLWKWSHEDAKAIYLATRLGVVTHVRLTTYRFFTVTSFCGAKARELAMLTEECFMFFVRLAGKGVVVEFENEDINILWCRKCGGDVNKQYEGIYGGFSST